MKQRPLYFHFAPGPANDVLDERNDFGCDTVGGVKPPLDPGPDDLVLDLEDCVERKQQEKPGMEREGCHSQQEINTSIFSTGGRTFPLHWVSFELMPAVRTGLGRSDVFSLGDKYT